LREIHLRSPISSIVMRRQTAAAEEITSEGNVTTPSSFASAVTAGLLDFAQTSNI